MVFENHDLHPLLSNICRAGDSRWHLPARIIERLEIGGQRFLARTHLFRLTSCLVKLNKQYFHCHHSARMIMEGESWLMRI